MLENGISSVVEAAIVVALRVYIASLSSTKRIYMKEGNAYNAEEVEIHVSISARTPSGSNWNKKKWKAGKTWKMILRCYRAAGIKHNVVEPRE